MLNIHNQAYNTRAIGTMWQVKQNRFQVQNLFS